MTVTLDTAIFRYDNKDDLLVVIPNFQRLSPSGDWFYSPVSSVVYVLYGERVEKASRTGHAGAHAGNDAPQSNGGKLCKKAKAALQGQLTMLKKKYETSQS